MLAVGFALFSCAKPDQQDLGYESGSLDGSLDYITAVSPGTPVKTITNDGVKVLWTDKDQIGMYVAESATIDELKRKVEYTTNLKTPSAQARFGRTSDLMPGKVNGQYLAVYPASAVAQWGMPSDEAELHVEPFCYVNVPTQQTAVLGSWDKNAAVLAAVSETEEFVFRHAVSYLRFDITDQTSDFVSVRLSSTNKEKLSDSQAAVRYLASEELELIPGNTATDYVVLRNSESGPFKQGAYYMSFLPGEFTDGLTLFFTNDEGLVAEKSIAALTLKPGDVVDFGEVSSLEFKEIPVPLVKGGVYTKAGVNQGVVYWVNPDDPYKGKVVSVSSEEMIWSEGLIWTAKINSTTEGLANYDQFNSSSVYTDNKDKFYALKYCESLRETLGGNWYLPAPGELQALYNAYYGLSVSSLKNNVDYRLDGGALIPSAMQSKSEFDASFRLLGETISATLDGDADCDGVSDNAGYGDANGVPYWTSKINTGGPVQYVYIGVYNLGNNKDKYTSTKAYVRCIRDVE